MPAASVAVHGVDDVDVMEEAVDEDKVEDDDKEDMLFVIVLVFDGVPSLRFRTLVAPSRRSG